MEAGVQFKLKDKESIIIVGDYQRVDFLYNAEVLCKEYKVFFIEHEKPSNKNPLTPSKIGMVLYWRDFKNVDDLLIKIRPVAVVFYFLESYYHVLLNAICKEKKIPTFLLDHGLRNYKFLLAYFTHEKVEKKKGRFVIFQERIKKLSLGVFVNKVRFLIFKSRSLCATEGKIRSFYKSYYSIRSSCNAFQTQQILKSEFRNPDYYLCFSEDTFQFHKQNDGLAQSDRAKYIGLPFFDKFINNNNKETDFEPFFDKALLIDENVQDLDFLGWDKENYRENIQFLSRFLNQKGINLFVKIHPYGDLSFWKRLESEGYLKILYKDLADEIRDIRVIFGHYSSLLVPLAALKHTIVFSLQIHPNKEILLDDIIGYKAILPIKDFSQLEVIFEQILLRNNSFFLDDLEVNKESLRVKFYLDGNSGKRLVDVINQLKATEKATQF